VGANMTPAYNLITKLAKGEGGSLNDAVRALIAKIRKPGINLEQIAKAELSGIFQIIANKADITKITSFLDYASKLMKNSALEAKLAEIKKIVDRAEREKQLRTLLLEENFVVLFAQCLKNERDPSKEENLDNLVQDNLKKLGSQAEQRYSQVVYGQLEEVMVMWALNAGFLILDLCLIEAGLKPVFNSDASLEEKEKTRFLPPPRAAAPK